MSDQLRDIFFQLLKIGLWGNFHKLYKHLTEDEWDQIYNVAIKHTVEGIIYDSFKFLEEEFLPPQSLRLKWAIRIDHIERHNAKMNAVLVEQYQSFTELGINPVLQKGQGVARCYDIPSHRISGDIDWCFEDGGYAIARNFLKERELDIVDTAGFSLAYKWKGIDIEHHKNLFDFRSPLKSRFLKTIEKYYRSKQLTIEINSVPIRLLAPELQMLQVNGHILKHLISFGMGLRQFCDSAKLYAYYYRDVDNQALLKIYKNAGILKWIYLLHEMLIKYIGLPEAYLPFEQPKSIDVKWMLEEVWHGGNFGYYDDRYKDGKIIKTVSSHPNGARRLWDNFKRYFPYAPQEAFFFPIIHIYSKFIGIDRD